MHTLFEKNKQKKPTTENKIFDCYEAREPEPAKSMKNILVKL